MVMLLFTITNYAQTNLSDNLSGMIRINLSCSYNNGNKYYAVKGRPSHAPSIIKDCPVEVYYDPSSENIIFINVTGILFTYSISDDEKEEILFGHSIPSEEFSVSLPIDSNSSTISIATDAGTYEGTIGL